MKHARRVWSKLKNACPFTAVTSYPQVQRCWKPWPEGLDSWFGTQSSDPSHASLQRLWMVALFWWLNCNIIRYEIIISKSRLTNLLIYIIQTTVYYVGFFLCKQNKEHILLLQFWCLFLQVFFLDCAHKLLRMFSESVSPKRQHSKYPNSVQSSVGLLGATTPARYKKSSAQVTAY